MYAAFDDIVREEVDGEAFAAVTGPRVGTLDGAFPVPPPTERPLTCTSRGPGHCISPLVDDNMNPVLAEEPVIEAAIVEVGNRIVLSVEGGPHGLHTRAPWGLLLVVRAGRAARWNTPHPLRSSSSTTVATAC